MQLLISGTMAPVTLIDETSSVSRHTGKELRHLTVELQYRGKGAERQVREALDDETITVVMDDGEEVSFAPSTGGFQSHRVDDGPTEFTQQITLDEFDEKPVAREVRFEGIVLTPATYEETSDDDCLHVMLTTVVTPEVHDRLFALQKDRGYFDVARDGVNEASETMRLGRLLWSREADQIRQEVNLVDKRWDEVNDGSLSGFSHMVEPFKSRAEEQLVAQGAVLEHLVDALAASGALSDEQLHAVREVGDDEAERRSREFQRVDDLEKFLRLE